jgi:hypothetical protein
MRIRGSSDNIVTRLRAGRPGFDSLQLTVKGFFLVTTASGPALGHTQTPIQWVSEVLPLEVKVTTHIHLMPRLRLHEAITPFPPYVFMAW